MNPPAASPSELPAIGFLAEISAEHRAFLACFGRFLRPNNGDVLIQAGERQDCLYIILSGTLHIVANSAGRHVLLATLGSGDSLGEINLFDPDKASATAIARSNGLVWALSREELDGFLAADPMAGVDVLRGLLRQGSKRIRAMNDKLAAVEERASLHDFWTSGQS